MRTILITLALVVATSVASSQVVIHEFVAQNNTGIRDENNQYEDWLELVNLSASSADVSGFYLTDDLMVPTKWAIPANTIIPPNGTLLVWCDEDLNEGPYHADFKLAAAGEEIGLFATNGTTLLDSVVFGQQIVDVAEGRLHGATGLTWYSFPSPTPRALNQPEPCGNLAIDAISAKPNPGGKLGGVTGPQVGKLATWSLSGTTPNASGKVALAGGSTYLRIGPFGALFVNPAGFALFDVSTNGTGDGTFKLPVPNVGALAGVSFYMQALVVNGAAGGLTNGLIARVCP